MAIRLVIFDIAGTIIKDNSNVSKVLQKVLLSFGHPEIPLAQINPLMGYEKKYAIKQLLGNDAGISEEHIQAIHNEFVIEMTAFYTETELIPFDNVEETFLQLHQSGIKVAVNTGFSREIAQTIISRLEWEEKNMVDVFIASDEVPLGRPYPYMIRKLMEDCAIEDAAQVAKVGDTEVDIREGQQAGCRYVIGVTTGVFTREELSNYNPTHIVNDILEIIPIVTS